MRFEEAIEMGEYDPVFLSTFSEWNRMSVHVQLQHIRRAIVNRRSQLTTQWAEINNVLDFSMKPHLKSVLRGIEKQIRKVDDDEEELLAEYSRKL